MHTYYVKDYEDYHQAHRVIDAEGKERLVDMTSGSPNLSGIDPKSLIGKTVTAEWESPFITFAMDCQIVEPATETETPTQQES